ncbi:hypothetical protein [Miniphocaeibacter halophilus]|uniref:Uncharacterized protein n=1 Tax=Miniphocaeibacter halophilus TaxID=2931922 RepID=A0AC61MTB6_9FIRM|nr:hypothetical protein [Miniphocaeibacter halophilus]QQK08949.1 hypothetical protein JFY71_05275 [Miniphocaeibacter halophilus]
MKKFLKNNKIKIIIILMFTYIILLLVDLYFYRKFVNASFDEYVEAQGLKNEATTEKPELTNDNFFLRGKLKREIIYTENFRTHFVYETSGRRFPALPLVNLIDYKSNIEKNPNLYKGVNFYNLNYKGEIIFGEFGKEEEKIHEGQLDKSGNLLTELPWIKDYEYDENSEEVQEFIQDTNDLMDYYYEDGQVDEIKTYNNLRELYKDLVKEGTLESTFTYEDYLEYIVDSKMAEKKFLEDIEESSNGN